MHTRPTLAPQPAIESGQPSTNWRTGFRWIICTLLLVGVTKNYVDRLIISLLKTTLQHNLGWSEIDYGNLVFAFSAAYAAGMIVMGRLVDWLGTRIGYAIALVTWSLASAAHGLVTAFPSFLIARSVLGFSEAGVFPASLKAVAEWFPRKERALAAGIFNAGTNVGAVLAPLLVPWITARWGWRWAFISIGLFGFIWLVLWLAVYRTPEEHPRCSPEELQYIRSDPAEKPGRVPWLELLRHRQTWAFATAKFITDPIWWFYLFWTPDFLQREHGLVLNKLGAPLVTIYLLADIGSVAGGWLSSRMIRNGRTISRSRKTTMFLCGLSALPVIFVPHVSSMWPAVMLMGLAAAAHQGFSCNLLTLPSDMFPTKAVASIVGIGGTAGALGVMVISKIVSYRLQWTGSYAVPFAIAGSTYLVALGVLHLLAPSLSMAQIQNSEVRTNEVRSNKS